MGHRGKGRSLKRAEGFSNPVVADDAFEASRDLSHQVFAVRESQDRSSAPTMVRHVGIDPAFTARQPSNPSSVATMD